MAPYNANPGVNTPVPLLQPGVTGYAFGSFDSRFPTTLMQISNVALTGNVATITVLIREGKIPAAGSLLTIRGTSAASGALNVQNVAIGTVSIDAVTGIGTITFTLAHADIVSVANNGMAYVPVPEVGEALANGASQAFAIQDIAGHNENGLTLQWSTDFPSAPSTCTTTIQVADFDVDADYVDLDSSTDTGGDSRSITLTRFRFIRAVWSNVTGGSSPTGIVRFGI